MASRSWVTARGYRPDQGRSALDLLMSQSPPPTALVIANINAALGALKDARQLGLDVPANLSIVSIHDAWTAENTWPPLTAVKMPMRELGRAVVAALYNRVHDLPMSGHVVTDRAPLLMLRESTRVLR
ncbi:MAG TPA: substrate-binding domain-containing protein [Propionibacteriaceae bacterium]|nr:substrate-binding domain-containing protein [Propionibacteriaceae bacterium]